MVKQFRNDGRRERLRRRLRGSKAERSWRVARALAEAGIDTPEPLLLVESERPDGPSYFVSREVTGAEEARYLLRAVNAGALEMARIVEQLTPMLISVNSRYKTHAGIRLTGLPDSDHWA